jgi:cobalt-zinc-cadmium efflux system protein
MLYYKHFMKEALMHEHGHENAHANEHGHSHSHAPDGEKNLIISIIINLIITISQIIGGLWSGSLALLSDAFHNFSDVISLLISYIALQISKRSKNTVKTYGYKRAEIFAAIVNVLILFTVCGFIIYHAALRFKHPSPVAPFIMALTAGIGLLGNGISALMLLKGSKSNINIKSAYLHLLGDAVTSLAVLLAALILFIKPWYLLDAALSVIISLYIIRESYSILSESLNILMQGAPAGLDREKIKQALIGNASLNIIDIHHIHMWDITPGNTVFDAHIVVKKANLSSADAIIENINSVLSKNFGICHSTIQLESEGFNHCVTCDL